MYKYVLIQLIGFIYGHIKKLKGNLHANKPLLEWMSEKVISFSCYTCQNY